MPLHRQTDSKSARTSVISINQLSQHQREDSSSLGLSSSSSTSYTHLPQAHLPSPEALLPSAHL